jgi:glucosyl-3-phosphoglycerate synthase
MDFQQGLITTIHEYGVTRNLLKELNKSLKKRSTSILIPCLYEEFERPALKDIREVLKDLTGLNELVIALSAKTVEQVNAAKSFFDSMPFPVHVQWTNSPSVIELLKSQEKNGLELLGTPGKGWAVWQGIGVATRKSEVVALFDADIRTFSSLYPSRMILPLLDESYGISYVKAFYSRLSLETNQLQGRATRLFVGPLLASLEQLVGKGPFLQYLQSFRYPLAGEFAFTKDLAMNLRIPCDWGLEIGLLSEVYRNVRTSKIAQVDLGLFDHKHKNIGDSPKEGLQKMCKEILSSVLRGLMEHQAETLTSTQLATLEVLYKRVGEDRVKQFGLDSAVNQIPYDRHEEELSVQKFAKLLRPATEDYLACPTTQQLPSWSRVLSCEDKLQEDLAIAGSQDIKTTKKELIKNF